MARVRKLGSSGLETPPLVLGGNVFGWTASGAEAFRILDRFVEAGGRMIDTADVYSVWVPGHEGGESESLIGEWLRRRGGAKDEVLIATKVGMLPGEGGEKLEAARIAAAAEASLKRLGVETIDLYYAHRDDERTPLDETLAAFDRLVRDGKVRALGASNYNARRLREALDISHANGLASYSVLQPEYHLMNREFEETLQPLCLERGVAVLPYYGLASGFLTGKYRSRDDFGKSVRGGRMEAFFNPRGLAVLEALDGVAADAGATPAQVALAWLAAQPAIAAPIASARTAEQLEELIGAMDLKLDDVQLDRLDAASRETEPA